MMLDNMARSQEVPGDLSFNLDLTKSMFGGLLACVKTNNIVFDERHFNCMVRASLSIVPYPTAAHMEKDRKPHIVVTGFLTRLAHWFLAWGVEVFTDLLFNPVIDAGGKLKSIPLLQWSQSGMKEHQILHNHVTSTCYLSAAGNMGSKDMVKSAWQSLIDTYRRLQIDIGHLEWSTLAFATRKCGALPFYHEQLNYCIDKRSPGAIAARIQGYSRWHIKPLRRHPTSSKSQVDAHAAAESFYEKASVLLAGSLPSEPHTADISTLEPYIWKWPSTVPEEWQLKLYNDLNSGCNDADVAPEDIVFEGSPYPSTGISFPELRSISWKTINSLLLQIETFESRHPNLKGNIGDKDQAKSMSARLFLDASTRPDHRVFLLAHLEDIEKEKGKQWTEEEWRTKIINLRSPDYQPPDELHTPLEV